MINNSSNDVDGTQQMITWFDSVWNNNRQLVEAKEPLLIEVEKLIGEHVEDNEERYNFTWHGKNKVYQIPLIGTLCPCKNETLASGKILTTKSLGIVIRQQRKLKGVMQVEFAALSGVGVHFISDLENGKATVEMGKIITSS